MSKIVMYNRVSLDGFFAGPEGSIDWFVQDPEVDEAAHTAVPAETALFGRTTYQLFEGFWPQFAEDPEAPKEMRAMSDELNRMNKIVFSRTLQEVTWQNSTLVKKGLAQRVRSLREADGPAVVIFGSGTVFQQLAREGLIDEYVLVVTPVVLGAGKLLFADVNEAGLRLLDARRFDSGNVMLHYAAA